MSFLPWRWLVIEVESDSEYLKMASTMILKRGGVTFATDGLSFIIGA